MNKFGLAVLLVGAVLGANGQHYGGEHYYDHGGEYEFKYSVHDPYHGDIKSQSEAKIGGLVKGHYSLKETDGSTRDVVYAADKHSGFQAVVHKDGEQVFPPIVTKAQYAIPLHGGYQQKPSAAYYQQPSSAYYQPSAAYQQPSAAYYQQPSAAYYQQPSAAYHEQPQYSHEGQYHSEPVYHYSY